jgi:hypothetical protein
MDPKRTREVGQVGQLDSPPLSASEQLDKAIRTLLSRTDHILHSRRCYWICGSHEPQKKRWKGEGGSGEEWVGGSRVWARNTRSDLLSPCLTRRQSVSLTTSSSPILVPSSVYVSQAASRPSSPPASSRADLASLACPVCLFSKSPIRCCTVVASRSAL